MPRRSTRVTAAATGRVSNTKKLTKAPAKTPPKQDIVDDPPMDDELAASPFVEQVDSLSKAKSDAAAPDKDADDSERASTSMKDVNTEKRGRTTVAVSNNRLRLPGRRAATQKPAKYAEEDSTTGSSSDDEDDEDRYEGNEGRHSSAQNKKRPKQQLEASGRNKCHRVTKAKTPSVAPRKSPEKLGCKNNKVASGTGLSVISKNPVSKRWEPNTGGDWRDFCAMDY